MIQRPAPQEPPITAPPITPTSPRINPDQWVKPDRLSGSFELRKYTLSGTRTAPVTDVYELYWAHLIRDTTAGQLLAWTRSVLLRRPSAIPVKLRKFYWSMWVLLLVVVASLIVLVATHTVSIVAAALTTGVLATVLGFVLKVAKPLGNALLLNYLGDAARYLRPDPGNVAERQKIREAGVDLLVKMHESGRYDRIVVLGHSLGSVIAYDILTFAWQRMNRHHLAPATAEFGALRAAEKAAAEEEAAGAVVPDGTAGSGFQDRQHAAWQQSRRNTQPWLVTDLVTAGSPLAHANLLLGPSAARVAADRLQRILPTSPPQLDHRMDRGGHTMGRFSFESPYRAGGGWPIRTFTSPDHAALFAVTRWTNLYFVSDRVLRGDPVGGRVGSAAGVAGPAGSFGTWIQDVPMPSPRSGPFGFAHTLYWQPTPGEPGDHLTSLSDALGINCRRELLDLNRQLPPHVFVRPSTG